MRPKLWVAAFCFVTIAATAQRKASISGAVYDSEGVSIAGAHVSVEVMQGKKIVTVVATRTNDRGRFLFSNLERGEYRLSAEKRESGYLPTYPDIYTCRPPITVVLSEESATVDIDLHLLKGAMISGWVKDSGTAESISAHLSLAPAVECGWSTTGTDGRHKFELLIPPDTPITFGACAEGYKPWTTPLALNLHPGSVFDVDVLLERDEKNEQTICSVGTY
jgi:hypothetical protein